MDLHIRIISSIWFENSKKSTFAKAAISAIRPTRVSCLSVSLLLFCKVDYLVHSKAEIASLIMSLLKEINDKGAVLAWSPKIESPNFIAIGTKVRMLQDIWCNVY